MRNGLCRFLHARSATNTRLWIDTMKELKLDYDYKEIPGADHGTVIEQGVPDIFAFFKAHPKKTR